MTDFQIWTDTFNLIHLPTSGAEFTWANGRRDLRYTYRRLDRAVCNQCWLDLCATLNVSTLTKHKSDHFPLLLDFNLTMLSSTSQFKFMRMWTLHPDCENLVKNCWNTEIIGCPMFVLTKKLKLLKEKLKIWNKSCFGPFARRSCYSKVDSAPGPDGFGAFFFQHFWEIVKTDVFKAVLEFFTTSWIMPGFNANIIALIPKTSDAISIHHYRPIAMANFKFKVISKIIADSSFGFNDVFCNWIHVILKSAFLSISINGKAEGYFNCSRGVRKGGPLSPLLFCIAEDVLSRSISKLVNDGKLDQVKGTRHIKVPSHTFYADDLMVYVQVELSGML
ncbi:RNA-directed DNA polymerase (Reverse transcriptase) [Trifolium medium]|uniref:RNA-directed DNA polymerase (Reverse transcriptase) n=1 Tax=Trifolium medium TaxID=97028 RepID=A0A392M3K1_9FABA|nr:RNA-directed DNA polymerase (Reverse transcriptase) [Trifolium medium]